MKTIHYENVYLSSASSVVGSFEKKGKCGEFYDMAEDDYYFGCKNWEDAESEMSGRAINILLKKSGVPEEKIDALVGGDLLNQCTATAFTASKLMLPFLGLYGACSTAAEGLLVGGNLIHGIGAHNVITLASSHFCTSERQYRFPLEYGCQRPQYSQSTVSGAGAFLLGDKKSEIRIKSGYIGRPIDAGVTDSNNMGAAMAPAAADTILRYFSESGADIGNYDIIATGDLGAEGLHLAEELLIKAGFDAGKKLVDCGEIIYDRENQDVHSGGSGCGCSAVVCAGMFYKKMLKGEIKRMLLVGTGALLSQKTVLQKKTIPGIAHLVEFESQL